MTAEALTILAGWTAPADRAGAERMLGRKHEGDGVIVGCTPGGLWLISGRDPYGRTHCGCRDDLLSLARDLAHIAEYEEKRRQRMLALGARAKARRTGAPPLFVADSPSVPAPETPTPASQPEQGAPAPDPLPGPHGQETAGAPAASDVPRETNADQPAGISAHTHHRRPYAGTMTLEDEPARLRAQLVDVITETEEVLLAAELDPTRADDLAAAARDYRNWPAGQPIPEALERKHQEFLADQSYAKRIAEHARSLRIAVRLAYEGGEYDRMRAMAAHLDQGWPKRR